MSAIKELGNLLHLWTYPISILSIEEMREAFDQFAEERLPRGNGINWGCKIDLDNSNHTKVTINFQYEHMNPEGFYVYISDHTIIIYATFTGFLIVEWDEESKAEYTAIYDSQEKLASKAYEKYIAINENEPIDEHLCEEYLGKGQEYYFLPGLEEFFEEIEMRFYEALTTK